MRSTRMGENLDDKLDRASATSGLTPSEVIRRGTEQYCDQILSGSLYQALKPFIGSARGQARRSGVARPHPDGSDLAGFGQDAGESPRGSTRRSRKGSRT